MSGKGTPIEKRRIKPQRKRVQIVKITVEGPDGVPAEVDAKECTKCGVVKALDDFYQLPSKVPFNGLGGVRARCKRCEKQISKEAVVDRYRTNPKYREKQRENVKHQYVRDMEKIKSRAEEWQKNNPTKVLLKKQRRRSRKFSLPSMLSVTPQNSDIYKKCALTDITRGLEFDHFIAISVGHGGTYEGNIYSLAGTLNGSKGNKNPFEWIRARPDIDPARFDAVVAYLADLNGLTPVEFRQYVDWCYANPRTIDEIKADNERYGYTVSSLELWRAATGMAFPLRIDFGMNAIGKRSTTDQGGSERKEAVS